MVKDTTLHVLIGERFLFHRRIQIPDYSSPEGRGSSRCTPAGLGAADPAPAPHLVPLHLLPEQHVIFQESSLQTDKMLELQTGDGIEEDPSEQEDLFGGAHPQAFGLRGKTTEK